MNNIYPDLNGDLRNGNIPFFLEIVIDNYLIISRNRKNRTDKLRILTLELPQKVEDLSKAQEKKLSRITESEDEDLKLIIQSIVMLTTFYEGLINEIGIIGLGQNYFKENLDKLNLKAKLEIVLKLVYGKGINRSSQYFENIILLIKNRNNLVHYKSKKITDKSIENIAESIVSHRIYLEILEKNMVSFEAFYNDLKKIDNEKGILGYYYNIEKQIKRI